MSRIANYCAVCGGGLIQMQHSGRIRPYCQACQQPTYFDPKVAVIIFAARADKVLLIQRAIDPGAGKWALPAGFVDYDEAPEEAAIREMLEETGLQVEIRELLAVFPKRDEGLADIAIAYRAEIIAGEAVAGDDAAALGFFAADQLPPLVFFPSITLVAQWRAGELAPQS
ncbi:MAG: NUDIX hydrolase [Chloroflexi bacterium]|nr:NUDIX hydrolase [Chloroflexota bacterium]MDE2651306.1 NUDIX hydrolase [Chloroflexota bacterium]